ncbi:Carbohydrate-responsive element-binding protein, partial [Geodia barretti]
PLLWLRLCCLLPAPSLPPSPDQKGSEPLFCTFDLNPNLNDHTRPEAVVLEGKYQKRKVEAVAREYRKWRMFHREKFRQGGCKRDPLLADLVENLRGDELGGGVELQAMQVDPPIPAGLIQLDELSDPLFMGLGQDYFPEYNASTNMMFQPKMDVLSSALDEFLGKLEPMEVLLSRTSSSNYQSPLVAFPQMTNPAPFPQATPPLQQQLFSPQMAHPSLPPSHPPMGSSLLSDFGVTDPPSSMFPSFSPPPQSYFDPQQSSNYDNRHSLTPAQTPPPDHQFSLPPEVPGGLETSSMFHFPLKRDPSSDSLKSPHGEFVAPSNGGQSPTNIPLTNPEYGGSRSQPSEYNFVSPGQPPMGRSDITVDTSQQRLSYRQISSGDMFPGVLDAGQRSTIDNVAMSYNTPQGGVVSMEGGGILGSKRKEGSHQFLPGSKRRSPHNSQSDLPLWGNEEGGAPGVPGSSMLPPSGPTFLSSRRASIGSAAQLSDRPVLQKNASEPAGSLLLREQLKLLTQQHEAHSQELDKQQSLAQQQYRDVLHQYKKQVVGQEQLSESDKHLLRTVLAKPALLDVLRALLSPSSSPSFSQPTPSPLLLTPSPTPSSSSHLPPVTSFLPAAGGGGSAERENPLPNEELASPENVKQVTEFQSRLLVAAAVQASGGSNTRASNSASLASTPEPAPFPGDTELLSPESRSGTGAETTPSISFKIKSSRGLSSEQKEVFKEIKRQSHITAEQRRRGTIKQGFDQLQTIVVDPSSYPSGKVSKATVLEKTVEFIERAHHDRDQREKQVQALRREQEELNAAIAECQENLPASGVPVTRQRFEENRRRFQEYIQRRTLQNYKFWIYSLILKQLFESYNSTVSTGNHDELCRTVLAWFEQNCSLHALRPVVMNSLKELSTKTSILSDPSQVPHQLVQYAKQQLETSQQDYNYS